MDTPTHDAAGGMNLEELLAERDWLVRLSRRLVVDASQADDLVQETLTRAIVAEQSRGSVRAPRAWLAGILRNVASEGRTRDTRRRLREKAVSSPEAGASGLHDPAEIQARAEYRALVAAELLELPQDQREVLTLRFYEGLSAVEIGRQVGLRPAAVRQRIRRAVEALRGRLDAADNGPGVSGGWLAAALPLAMDGLGVTGSRLGLVRGVGVALLAICTAAGLYASVGRGPVERASQVARVGLPAIAVADAELASVPTAAAEISRETASGIEPVVLSEARKLRIMLVDESSGAPAGGVRWRILRTGAADPGGAEGIGIIDPMIIPDQEPLAEGTTGPEGIIVWTAPAEPLLNLIVDRSERFARASFPLELDRGKVEHRVALGSGATLRLRTIEPDGGPAVGMALAREDWRGKLEVIAESGKNGLIEAPRLALLPRAFVRDNWTGEVLPDRELGEKLLVVPRGAVVQGQLLGPCYKRLKAYQAGVSWTLDDVQVPAETVVTGRVVDERGFPVSGALVVWRRRAFFQPGSASRPPKLLGRGQERMGTPARAHEAMSGPDGLFELRFRRLQGVRIRLGALTGDGSGGFSPWILADGAREAHGVEIVVEPARFLPEGTRRDRDATPSYEGGAIRAFEQKDLRVRCRVVDAVTGKPIFGAKVKVERADGRGYEQVATMLSGRAAVPVSWDAVSVTVSADGYEEQKRSGQGLTPERPLELGDIRLRRSVENGEAQNQ